MVAVGSVETVKLPWGAFRACAVACPSVETTCVVPTVVVGAAEPARPLMPVKRVFASKSFANRHVRERPAVGTVAGTIAGSAIQPKHV